MQITKSYVKIKFTSPFVVAAVSEIWFCFPDQLSVESP